MRRQCVETHDEMQGRDPPSREARPSFFWHEGIPGAEWFDSSARLAQAP